MSRSSVLILVGILLVIAPFAGVPSAWLAVLVPFFGLIVCVVGFLVRETQVHKAMLENPHEQASASLAPTTESQTPHTPPAKPGVSPI